MRHVYVIVEGSGPNPAFVEIEDADGQSVAIPWEAIPDNLHRIGPLVRAEDYEALQRDLAETHKISGEAVAYVERLRDALPEPSVLERVAQALESRGIHPPSDVEHLRAKGCAIRTSLE